MNRKLSFAIGSIFIIFLAGCATYGEYDGQWSSYSGDYWYNDDPGEVVVIPPSRPYPRSRIYFVPDINLNVFFHSGYWWGYRDGRWFRAKNYKGPWNSIRPNRVPSPIYRVPRDYKERFRNEPRIPWGNFRKTYERDNRDGRRDQDMNRNRRERDRSRNRDRR